MKDRFALILTLIALTSAALDRAPVKAVLFPFREATLSARAESELEPYRFRLGEPFPAGSVLVSLDASRYRIDVLRATEQLNFAKAAYEDKKQLREKNFTSDYELKKAEFDYRMAESSRRLRGRSWKSLRGSMRPSGRDRLSAGSSTTISCLRL